MKKVSTTQDFTSFTADITHERDPRQRSIHHFPGGWWMLPHRVPHHIAAGLLQTMPNHV